jgi:hypothetical protein
LPARVFVEQEPLGWSSVKYVEAGPSLHLWSDEFRRGVHHHARDFSAETPWILDRAIGDPPQDRSQRTVPSHP